MIREIDTLSLVFGCWRRGATWYAIDRAIVGRKRRCNDQWEASKAEDIENFRRTRDFRSMWKHMRMLGGTGVQVRRRNTRAVKRADPDTRDWMDAMAKAGKDGGCLAEEVQRGEPAGTYDRKTLVRVAEGCGERRPFCDGDSITDAIVRMKYLRSVPRGRARKELYQMALEGDPRLRSFYAGLFNQLNWSGRTLGTFQLADAAQLDKHNGKLGTAGTRLIMMLDPMGKAYYWLLHARTSDSPHHFGVRFLQAQAPGAGDPSAPCRCR